MNKLCRQFVENPDRLLKVKIDKSINRLNYYARKYRLTIFYYNGQLKKSKDFGQEMFIRLVNDLLMCHSNPGILAKLPTGVGKLKGSKYKLSEIFGCDDCEADWSQIETKIGKGINIWRKTSTGLNKHNIKNLRRSNLQPAIHLHCDDAFNKTFLVTCDKLYFRGYRNLIN